MDTINEDIWKDLEELLKESQNEIPKEIICGGEMCSHSCKQLDAREGIHICIDCGIVIQDSPESCEWNNYKKEDGSFQIGGQRADLYVSDNPYDKGGSIPGFNKYSFAMRLHYQQVFSHKQKTFWKISEKLQTYCTLMKIPSLVLSDAKNMWHICMESGKLTRAGPRNGLISACLYYSCINNNVHVDRQKIIDGTEGNQKGFGLLPGKIKRFKLSDEERIKIPHMGWNNVMQSKPHPLWNKIETGSQFYFVHSYYAEVSDKDLVVGYSEHGEDFACAIAKDNIFATQFHPEKSAELGLQLLKNFILWDI